MIRPVSHSRPEPTRTPTRTCVGCRRPATKSSLVRLVLARGHVVVDGRQRLPGRGAYVHPNPACLTPALSRGGVARGLRFSGRIDPEIVGKKVAEVIPQLATSQNSELIVEDSSEKRR